MWNCVALKCNLKEVFLSVLDTLTDSVWNLSSFSDTETDSTVAVAYNYKSSKLIYCRWRIKYLLENSGRWRPSARLYFLPESV